MTITGPIVVIEDDRDDDDLICTCISDNGFSNQLRRFKNGQEALNYLHTTTEQPFIILADIMMQMLNGLELLKRINADPCLHKKAIPFVFLTKAVSPEIIEEAFHLFAQGFFEKASNYPAQKEQIKCILHYWKHCKHPNNIAA